MVQDAILRAYRSFDSLRGSDAKTWLMVIVRNCHLSAVKQRLRRGTVALPEEYDEQDGHSLVDHLPGPESVSILRDQKDLLVRLIAALPRSNARC